MQFKRKKETEQAINYLLQFKVGEIATYDQIRKDFGKLDMNLWYRVRQLLAKQHDIVFETLQGVGYKRLNNEECVMNTDKYFTRRTKGVVKRSHNRIKGVDMARLSSKNQIALTVLNTKLELARTSANTKNVSGDSGNSGIDKKPNIILP